MGQIDILNTGAGHLVIKVPDDQSEIDKANSSRIITDMLRRGYLLFVSSVYRRSEKHGGATAVLFCFCGLPIAVWTCYI